jgi:hypothetical protein
MTLGYNTRSGSERIAKTYEDLLHPRWKGQMMGPPARLPCPSSSATFSYDGQEAGKAYRKAQGQNIAKSTASARQILDLVIAGEYPLAVQIFNHHAYISKTAGAPVEWQPLEPVTATINTIGLAKNAPRPHAAMLFLDFLLSKKGQKIVQVSNYLPSHPEIPALQADLKPGGGRFKKANYINPDFSTIRGTNGWTIFRMIPEMKIADSWPNNSHRKLCYPWSGKTRQARGVFRLKSFPVSRSADLGAGRGLARDGVSRPASPLFSYPNQSFHYQAHRGTR